MRTQHVYTTNERDIRKLNQPKDHRAQNATDAKQVGRWPRLIFHLLSSKLRGGNTNAVVVAEKENTLALTLGTFRGLNPLASTGRGPHGLEEANPARVGLGAVVLTHDGLDGLGGLVGVVEGDVADIVVQDVSLDDAVEDVTAHKAEVTVDGGSGATGKVPHFRLIVGESGVGVLQVGDGNCANIC